MIFEGFDNLLALHKVVAVLAVNHKELIVCLEVLADHRFMGVPVEDSSL
jgi:hypothetical protein